MATSICHYLLMLSSKLIIYYYPYLTLFVCVLAKAPSFMLSSDMHSEIRINAVETGITIVEVVFIRTDCIKQRMIQQYTKIDVFS